VGPGVEALVLECMAVRPAYQEYAQDHIVRADITIITNVREDHQEEMGETLEEIADSMALTTPVGGVLITAEDRGHLRDRLAERARERGSEFRYADPAAVDKSDMRGFGYIQFAENVAIGLEVARIVGIPREAAIRGMWKSTPDVGVVRLEWYPLGESRVLWIPLFAANDRESVVRTFEALQPQFPDGAQVIGILNNRQDRGRRAELFADMVPNDLEPFLDPLAGPEFTFSRAWLREVFAHINDPRRPNYTVGMKLNLPPEYLLIHRVWLGGIGVLCQIGGTVNGRDAVNAHLPGAALP